MIHSHLATHRKPGQAATRTAFICLAAVWLAACSGAHSYESASEHTVAVPVKIQAVAQASISGSVEALAELEADRDTQVLARSGGQVVSLAVEEGDEVSRGQVLLSLDDEQARMALQQAEAILQRLEREWQRSSDLIERQLVSREAHDRVRFDYQAQQAAVALLRADLSDKQVKAPFDGIIAERLVNKGEVLKPLQAAFRLVDPTSIQAVIHVPEKQLGSIQAGMPAIARLAAYPDQQFNATVIRVAPRVDYRAGTGRVVIAFNDANTLRPGQFGSIKIKTAERANALVIAAQSVVLDGPTSVVYVISDAGLAQRKQIVLGQQVDATHVEVISGLSVNDRVVSEGHNRLDDGSFVLEV
ncbi:MAG: MexH family multidrug efflux RND transporter periplasmic adaptor subunit [Lysobacteraceae bacterium]|nr:MAG: MexH family multidrug efflux RND transporter periplasmic adaptor subunit [Xanthomonadaceae bacterium]